MATAQEAKSGLAAHEDVCAERYKRLDELISGLGEAIKSHAANSKSQVDDVKDGLKWAIRLAATILIGLVAYFGNQVIGG